MLTAETVHPEGARYAACQVLVPGLWAGPETWRAFAGLLAHRGWECHLVDVRGLPGGLAARSAALADYVAALPMPAVLVGHDAGALAALGAAGRCAVIALVLISPMPFGSRSARSLCLSLEGLVALLLGRPVPPPSGRAAALLSGGLPEPARTALHGGLAAEDAATVRDVLWGRVGPAASGVPTLVLSGADDPLLPPAAASAFAAGLGAEQRLLDGVGHWPLAGPAWQDAAGALHRWVVQRLGAPLLELYEEAMAERDVEEGEE